MRPPSWGHSPGIHPIYGATHFPSDTFRDGPVPTCGSVPTGGLVCFSPQASQAGQCSARNTVPRGAMDVPGKANQARLAN